MKQVKNVYIFKTFILAFLLLLTSYGKQQGGGSQEENDKRQKNYPTSENILDMAFVPVQAGTFQMGSDSEEAEDDEQPIHTVEITQRFWIGKYEVTLGEYRQFMKSTDNTGGIAWYDLDCPYKKERGYPFSDNRFAQDKRQPAVEVSWHGAVAFCEWLTEKEKEANRLLKGYEYRLPTEAEWEYAARGGQKSKGYKYSGSNEIDEVAWYKGNSNKINRGIKLGTQKVGQKKPNELGIHDMSGNVWEWCYDRYEKDCYSESPRKDPVNTTAETGRLNRGGCWSNSKYLCRSTNRDGWDAGNTDAKLGFRVVLAPEISEENTENSEADSEDTK